MQAIAPKIIGYVVDELLVQRASTGHARKATKYISETCVVTATRKHKPDKRSKRTEILLKLGAPNFREKAFIRACVKAGEPFPVRKIQLRFYPAK